MEAIAATTVERHQPRNSHIAYIFKGVWIHQVHTPNYIHIINSHKLNFSLFINCYSICPFSIFYNYI